MTILYNILLLIFINLLTMPNFNSYIIEDQGQLRIYIIQVVYHGVARDFYYQLFLSFCLTLSLSLSISLYLSHSHSYSHSHSHSHSHSYSYSYSHSHSHSLSFFLSVCLSLFIFLTFCLFLPLCLSKKSLQFQVLRQNDCSCGSNLVTTHLLYR